MNQHIFHKTAPSAKSILTMFFVLLSSISISNLAPAQQAAQPRSITADQAEALAKGLDPCGNSALMRKRLSDLLNSDMRAFVQANFEQTNEFACQPEATDSGSEVSLSSAGTWFNSITQFTTNDVRVDEANSSLETLDTAATSTSGTTTSSKPQYCNMEFMYHSDWDSRHYGPRTSNHVFPNQINSPTPFQQQQQQPRYDFTLMVHAIIDPYSNGFNKQVDRIMDCGIEGKEMTTGLDNGAATGNQFNVGGQFVGQQGTAIERFGAQRQGVGPMPAQPDPLGLSNLGGQVFNRAINAGNSGPVDPTLCRGSEVYFGEKCDPNAPQKNLIQQVQSLPGEAIKNGQNTASGLTQRFMNFIFGGGDSSGSGSLGGK